MTEIPARLNAEVVQRACDRCEYCRLSQVGQEATFHVDHIIPVIAGGPTTLDNLALACVSCSLRKGARLTASDPESGLESPLFNPRLQDWHEHFRWEAERVAALTSTGRATIAALAMNRPLILGIRIEESHRGRHPPS